MRGFSTEHEVLNETISGNFQKISTDMTNSRRELLSLDGFLRHRIAVKNFLPLLIKNRITHKPLLYP